MRLIISALTCLFLISACKSETKSTQTSSDQNEAAQTTVLVLEDAVSKWSLGIIPPHRCPESKVPLIIYLHGGIGTERTDKGAQSGQMFQFIQESFPAIVASPSANRYAPWWSETGISRIFKTVDTLCRLYSIDSSKIFLTGVSDGATGLFAAASVPNHPFAGFIGAAGYPLLYGTLDWNRFSTAPIHLYISGKDRLYPADSVTAWCEKHKTEIPLTCTLVPDAEHGFDYRTEKTAEISAMLHKWKRNGQ